MSLSLQRLTVIQAMMLAMDAQLNPEAAGDYLLQMLREEANGLEAKAATTGAPLTQGLMQEASKCFQPPPLNAW